MKTANNLVKEMKKNPTPGPWRYMVSAQEKDGTPVCYSVLQKNNPGRWIAHIEFSSGVTGEDRANANLLSLAPELLQALTMQVSWKMRDGSPCACPAGKNEDGEDSKGKMPTTHSTACQHLRDVLMKVKI